MTEMEDRLNRAVEEGDPEVTRLAREINRYADPSEAPMSLLRELDDAYRGLMRVDALAATKR